ncbi:MAG TPA: bifunctional homocysteine S-methyltransferase/methylenetetrahydrofolate reductase [Polyangiaceae bacterium]|jgi:homocysteine S-methyltransferase|nr:MAG: Bifunctional homocysteine S-methyltransferase/5,10-methylenetetrahydrofolate reductase [Deltaproteobacteria bacterium ADurb.Bin207]HNS98467.1 bifunctional homocysteine S-methyltransferase/methylenetetrahydrofolate reductase [Polyangiaceae bacterium]HNZ23105.1 bifunctional homocysteine S-methyltransferase/methylenetetrahydrofolate reductase [Polyangiaceae bacterium]HOD21117.1 bifunctional homocysteine S-methyltransferase/methylenetetrahydrofolate reductase [Polyangiaceae bacterium]HOE488
MRKPFRERLEEGTVLFDGGMGTMLYTKGIYINTCFDELNITAPHLVRQVHDEYLRAGADAIETNTFGASSYKLEPFGLAQKLHEINLRGAQIAREAAGDDVYVAGAIGPLGVPIEPIGRVGFDEARADFAKRVRALREGGVDLIILETFLYLSELEQAILAVRDECDLPVIAQVVIRNGETLAVGTPISDAVARINGFYPDMVGFNCAVGPKEMLDALETAVALTSRPISLMPNAGEPRRVEGRTIYLGSPEYFAEFSKRFVQTGARIIGGCCGTTPEHIKAMRRAIAALEPAPRHQIQVRELQAQAPPEITPYSPQDKSRLSCRLADHKYVTLCELVSPKGVDAERVLKQARQLAHHGVDAINIPDGPRASSRMSALALAILIQRNVNIEVLLHYTCRDRNVIGMQSDLLGAWALGIRNILAVTGDPPKLGNYPDATAVYDVDAIGLTNLLWRLNHGLDIARNPIGEPTGFLVGVGANPGAINLEEELRRLEYKIEAGAEFIITQPVFDLRIFETFLRRIEPIRVPVLSGIWPLVSLRNAEFLNHEVPGASVPDDVMEKMRAAKSKEEALAVGTAVAQQMVRHVRPHTQGIQIAVPFGRVDMVLEVLDGVL